MSTVNYSKWDQLEVDDPDDEPSGAPLEGLGFDPAHPPPLTISTGEQALSLAKQGGDKKMEAMISRLVCQKYLDAGDVKRSRELIDVTMSLAKELGELQLLEDCEVILGQVLQLEGNVDEAMIKFAAAVVRYNKLGNSEAEATQRLNLGKCYEMKAQLREADECFQMALAIAKRMQPPNQQLVDIATTARAQTQQLAQELQQMALQAQSQAQAQSQMQGREGADSQEQSDGGSFLSRAKAAGWEDEDEEDSDSDVDITGASKAGPAANYQKDMQALNDAMSDAAKAIADLRRQGRNAEADELETLMNASDASSDGGNDDDSDIVDCEDLE
mmetsp:Transcript_11345/g.21503  ORF Transcript_11345/g.21503 Transcript_11345/m.21503 type:complete len:330 (-) Transcript_11345:314-1303(-)